MAYVFGVRGTSKNARYSNGGPLGVDQNSEWTVTADGTAISGSALVAGANTNRKAIVYPGRYNTPNGRAISILCRTKRSYSNAPTASTPVLPGLYVGNGRMGRLEFTHALTSGNINLLFINQLGSNCLNASIGNWLPTSGTWYDLVMTWDGTTTTNAIKFYVDNVLLGQATASAALSASWANTWWSEISLGDTVAGAVWNGSSVEELVVWDTVINPGSVALVSGTGALNGAARTSPVDVTAFDGSVNTGAGAANIRSGISEVINGVTINGTAAIPAAADVRSGTAVDATTGSLVVPAAADVREGTPVDATTGTLDLPAEADVLFGVEYDNSTKTGTAEAELTAGEVATELLDTQDVESGMSVRESLRLILSALAGKVSGGGTTTITIRNTADSKNRIVATVDANGNRSAVTYDVTD
jgi:hypothetical protein